MENKEILEEEIVQEETTTTEAETTEEMELSVEEKLTMEVAEMKDKYIRLYSEFENFRRRTAKEKIDLMQNASEGLIKELLPVLDDFERANKSFETVTEMDAVKEGIGFIYSKITKTLAAKGVKVMEVEGADFDVELHECITQFAAGEDKKGKVINEIEKGYYLNDKVIRYAKVVVGQ
jgi:molecular chaperone GrpE